VQLWLHLTFSASTKQALQGSQGQARRTQSRCVVQASKRANKQISKQASKQAEKVDAEHRREGGRVERVQEKGILDLKSTEFAATQGAVARRGVDDTSTAEPIAIGAFEAVGAEWRRTNM